MSLREHAKREMDLAWPESDNMQDMVKSNVMELIETFCEQGHSGTSAPYILNIFNKLARYETIAPLTGEDDEWNEITPEFFQNKRNSAVFKDSQDGGAYWIEGIIFRCPDGSCYTNHGSRVPVVFPWVQPEHVYIDVEE